MQAGRGVRYYGVIPLSLSSVLWSGLFGAGMRAVQEREKNICVATKSRPFHHTASDGVTFTGWILFMPQHPLILALAHFVTECLAANLGVALAFISLGIVAFRSIGLYFLLLSPFDAGEQILIQLTISPCYSQRCDVPDDHVSHVVGDGHKIIPTTYLVRVFKVCCCGTTALRKT